MAAFSKKEETVKETSIENVLDFIRKTNSEETFKMISDALRGRQDDIKRENAKDIINKVKIGMEVAFTLGGEPAKGMIIAITSDYVLVHSDSLKRKKNLKYGDFTIA